MYKCFNGTKNNFNVIKSTDQAVKFTAYYLEISPVEKNAFNVDVFSVFV